MSLLNLFGQVIPSSKSNFDISAKGYLKETEDDGIVADGDYAETESHSSFDEEFGYHSDGSGDSGNAMSQARAESEYEDDVVLDLSRKN